MVEARVVELFMLQEPGAPGTLEPHQVQRFNQELSRAYGRCLAKDGEVMPPEPLPDEQDMTFSDFRKHLLRIFGQLDLDVRGRVSLLAHLMEISTELNFADVSSANEFSSKDPDVVIEESVGGVAVSCWQHTASLSGDLPSVAKALGEKDMQKLGIHSLEIASRVKTLLVQTSHDVFRTTKDASLSSLEAAQALKDELVERNEHRLQMLESWRRGTSLSKAMSDMHNVTKIDDHLLPACSSRPWRYDAGDGMHLDIRTEPDVNGKRSGSILSPGDMFEVSAELQGANGVTYLRLADGRGWAFDYKPGVGTMCVPCACVAKGPSRAACFGGA